MVPTMALRIRSNGSRCLIYKKLRFRESTVLHHRACGSGCRLRGSAPMWDGRVVQHLKYESCDGMDWRQVCLNGVACTIFVARQCSAIGPRRSRKRPSLGGWLAWDLGGMEAMEETETTIVVRAVACDTSQTYL
jgi:hypothetical protein